MSTCPTVKVVSPESPCGFVIINESDRKPHHKIWMGDDDGKSGGLDRSEAPAIAQRGERVVTDADTGAGKLPLSGAGMSPASKRK